MPVGEMLRRMDSRELTEWRAFFLLRREEQEKQDRPKGNTPAELRAMFAHRVVKKAK